MTRRAAAVAAVAWLSGACVVEYDAGLPGDGSGDARSGLADAGAPADAVVPVDLGGEVMDAPDVDGVADVTPDIPPGFDPIAWPSARACADDPACPGVLVVAHRGLHDEEPENSLASIRAAARERLDFAEVDVRVTADGALVLMHDDRVDRTTDGSGAVADLTLAQLQALSLDGAEGGRESARVPTFDDALVLAAELGIALYVDIKDAPAPLLAAALARGNFLDVAMLRDDLDALVPVVAARPGAWTLVPVMSVADAESARGALGTTTVEVTAPLPDPELTGALRAAGFRVQQDVIAGGDSVFVTSGATSGWTAYLDAGVTMLQSNVPVPLRDLTRAAP